MKGTKHEKKKPKHVVMCMVSGASPVTVSSATSKMLLLNRSIGDCPVLTKEALEILSTGGLYQFPDRYFSRLLTLKYLKVYFLVSLNICLVYFLLCQALMHTSILISFFVCCIKIAIVTAGSLSVV